MFEIFWSIIPIFLLIVLGNLLRRNGIPSLEFWNLNDKLVYWVLFPALLFYETSTNEISGDFVGTYSIIVLGGFATAVAFGLLAQPLFRLTPQVGTSILQGASRHNTFIALAIADRLFGAEGLIFGTLVTAILIPPTNIVVIGLMNVLLRRGGAGAGNMTASLLKDLARNPLILSVGLGVGLNMLDVGRIPVVHDSTELLGRAALPIVLLAVGANIHVRSMKAEVLPLCWSTAGKFLVFPAAALGLCHILGVNGTAAYVIAIFAAMPTASSAFTIARQMGGDAPLAASMITVQTLLSLVTVPLTLVIAQRLF